MVGNQVDNTNRKKYKTSTEAKKRYNDKTYSNVTAYIPKDIAFEFKAKCKEKNIPIAQVIRKAIDEFLENN